MMMFAVFLILQLAWQIVPLFAEKMVRPLLGEICMVLTPSPEAPNATAAWRDGGLQSEF
jgi:hypothetical protein